MSMTREEIIKSYEDAVVASGLAAAAGNEEAAKSYELFKAGLYALRPVSREQVEKVWRGKWVPEMNCLSVAAYHTCSKCGEIAETVETGDEQLSDFCPFCGAPMTDEAVEMVVERLEKLKNEIG